MTQPNNPAPQADPTALTTDQLEREIKHLRELIEARLNQMDSALEAAKTSADTAIQQFDVSISHRMELAEKVTETKFDGVIKEFVTFQQFLNESSMRAQVALEAADKAVDAAFASSKEAIAKAENFNEKRFDILNGQIKEVNDNLSKQMDELKLYQASTVGRSTGLGAGWAYLLGAVGLIGGVIGIILSFQS